MEPRKTNFNYQNTPTPKQLPIQIRFVSNKDKENVSDEIIHVNSERLNEERLNSFNQNSIEFTNYSKKSQNSLNPFKLCLDQNPKEINPILFENISENFENLSRSLKKTDSLSTFQSEVSDLSLRTLNNQKRGFVISEEDQQRVLKDITCFFKVDSENQIRTSLNSLENSTPSENFDNFSINEERNSFRHSDFSAKRNLNLLKNTENKNSKENKYQRMSLLTPMKYKNVKKSSNIKPFKNRNKNSSPRLR